jgi:hypothetical protein
LRRLGRLLTASAGLLSISQPQLTVGDFSQPSVGTSAFQGAVLSPSSRQLNLRRNCVSALKFSAKNEMSKFLCFFFTIVPRCGSRNTKTHRTREIHHRTDYLLLELHAFCDGQAASPVKDEAKHS